jgi:TrmH family RNA methyltransferase
MFLAYKLERLPPGQRRRKLVLLLTGIERDLSTGKDLPSCDEVYVLSLVRLVLEDPKVDLPAAAELGRLLLSENGGRGLLRICNCARHALLSAVGSFPAEWDLVHSEANNGDTEVVRFFHPGISAYAEDIRSPFNLGSIFRTAEAFGAEKMILSPLCVPPSHPRAQRSAMGCIDYLPWERLPLQNLPAALPVFALETGGIPIGEFEFPSQGIVIIGSEELGVSPEGLSRASYGRVSIPMAGIKASLNVGVAFGILMQAWTSYLFCSEAKPL